MAALDAGDSPSAAARFAAFLSAHPRDARAEDAAYLRVIALQRAGDTSRMKRAAAEYHSRYPKAFRRAEVETLAR
jgi:TolA-binding protein